MKETPLLQLYLVAPSCMKIAYLCDRFIAAALSWIAISQTYKVEPGRHHHLVLFVMYHM